MGSGLPSGGPGDGREGLPGLAPVGAATPMKSPSRTTTTPSMASAGARSIDSSFAAKDGGRRTLPRSAPSGAMSEGYLCAAVTRSRKPGRSAGRPRIFQSATAVTATSEDRLVELARQVLLLGQVGIA